MRLLSTPCVLRRRIRNWWLLGVAVVEGDGVVAGVGERGRGPGGPAAVELEAGGGAVRVVVGELVALAELEAGDEGASRFDVLRTSRHQRGFRSRRREQGHVAG